MSRRYWTNWTDKSWKAYMRRRIIRFGQVEGVSYGVPQILHNGRKPTARRRS